MVLYQNSSTFALVIPVKSNIRQTIIICDYMTSDISSELAKLKTLRGSDFVGQLKTIAARREFRPYEDNPNIFIVGGERDADFINLINAALKVVEHGYRVYLLPNPLDFRTADFILERRGIFKLFDLKTISGKTIVGSRLIESIGLSNRVMLNMTIEYNTRLLAADIRMYFETYSDALEVMILKGKKVVSVDRSDAFHSSYYRIFKKRFEK